MATATATAEAATAEPVTAAPVRWASDEERLRSFGRAIDAIRERAEASVGADDLAYIRRVERVSRACEIAGRVLIHVSLDPASFAAGVAALWVHKQLQATEIGHTVLHGAFDELEGADEYRSRTYTWDLPIDEESWRRGHNVRHHGYTNVAGKDPDINFGIVRLTEHTRHRAVNYLQVPIALALIFPNFGWMMNMHFTGLNDLYFGSSSDGKLDVLPDRSRASIVAAHRAALRKFVPYFARNYLLYPLLAGPGFLKVLFGNWLAETARDVYSAATIFCGHVGEEVSSYPEGTRARGRGEWYAMQVEAANDFEVPLPISILCGALDRQIEHHLFPRLPTNRLREIAPAVRAACEEHGVRYRTAGWGRTLGRALRHLLRLSKRGARSLLRVAA